MLLFGAGTGSPSANPALFTGIMLTAIGFAMVTLPTAIGVRLERYWFPPSSGKRWKRRLWGVWQLLCAAVHLAVLGFLVVGTYLKPLLSLTPLPP